MSCLRRYCQPTCWDGALQEYGGLQPVVVLVAHNDESRKAITVGNEFGGCVSCASFNAAATRAASYQITRWHLVEAATKHEGRCIWGAMFRALTLVLCCTGIRLGEAVRLRIDVVDLRQGILTGD